MKNNLIKILFSSGLQAIAVQVLGATFFFVIANYLSKDSLGIINGTNAKAVMLTTLLSFGMDQVVVRRIAASKSSDWAAAAYLFHAFAGSVIVFVLLVALHFIFHGTGDSFQYLPWFFAAQAITYIGTPLKQFLNAKQNFGPYGIIAVCSNTLKIALAIYLIARRHLSLSMVVWIMGLCAAFELISLLVYVTRKTDFRFRFRTRAYQKLIRESLPQYVSVIFDSSLSRMDWILLGILSTAAMTADYTVASRAFEIARLPMAIIAPILLANFARMLAGGSKLTKEKEKLVKHLFTIEMFLSMLIPLLGNILWSPVLDYFFKGKYGTANAHEFMLLSICVPTQFFINLLWTLSFSGRRYKQITAITIYSAICNICISLVLIPLLGSLGAAISFLTTTLLQLVGHYIVVRKNIMKMPLRPYLTFLVLAAAIYIVATNVTHNIFLQLTLALGLYLAMSVLMKLVRHEHVTTVKMFIRK